MAEVNPNQNPNVSATPAAPPQTVAAPAAPAANPTPTPAPAAAPQPVTPAPSAPAAKPTVPAPAVRPGQPTAAPAGARKPPNPKRLLYWALGCFGCSILLFVLFVLLFAAQTSPDGSNALAKSLNLDPATFLNSIITLVNVIFGFFSIILFIIATVGVFRAAMARKDDKDGRKKGLTLAGAAGLLLTFMVFIWVGIYVFLSSKKVLAPQAAAVGIVTDPANTKGLTAPITIKFDGTKLPLDTKRYEILSFLWNFDDGDSSTVQSPSHTYKDRGKRDGRFDVKVTVALREIATGKETSQTFGSIVTVSNVKLNAEFAATPDSGPAPLNVEFDASGSSAPAGQIQNYEWDFDNTNTFRGGSGNKIQHRFEQVGKYTVNLRVTDNTGQFAVVSKDITVEGPNLPTAVINIPTTDGHYYTGEQYTFNGDKSSSPNGIITKYEWDFGDQTPHASTRTATHTYKTAGEFVVALTTIDTKGGASQGIKKITVENPVGAPIAAITTVPAQAKNGDGFINGTVPFEVAFDGGLSKEENGTIVDYKWDFLGDGKTTAAGKQVKYVFKEAGTYNTTLTVEDAQNKTGTAILIVKVANQGLQARVTATPVEGVVPMTVVFDASGSSFPSGQIVSYEWDFGDGTPKRIDVSKVTYKYTQIGTFAAKVTAVASDGTRSTTSIPVNVRPVPLKACFEASATQGDAPLKVEFDPRCSTGSTSKYSWDFGDGENSKIRKPTHNFTKPGSYIVILEVSDSQNVVDTFTMNILVTGTIN